MLLPMPALGATGAAVVGAASNRGMYQAFAWICDREIVLLRNASLRS